MDYVFEINEYGVSPYVFYVVLFILLVLTVLKVRTSVLKYLEKKKQLADIELEKRFMDVVNRH
jgi:hypothetical protein